MYHNPIIDSMRGLSILAVILLHLYIWLPFTNTLPSSLINIIFRSGYYGVIVFFVISGFLITQSILTKWRSLPAIQLSGFYRMRFARIMPCLVLLVVILSLLDVLQLNHFTIVHTTLLQAIFAAFTFHINWLEAKTGYLPGAWDVLWSLSVEEVFYLFFPLLCLFIKNQRVFIGVLVIFIIAGPVARTVITNDIWQDKSYLSCMDGMAFGVLAAIFTKQKVISTVGNQIVAIVGLSLFSLVFFFRHWVFAWGITPLGLNVTLLEFSIALLLMASDHKISTTHSKNWLGMYGRSSYEIYLSHMFVIMVLAHFFRYSGWLWLVYLLAIIVAGVIAQIIARGYSEPLNRFIRAYSRKPEKQSA